MRPLFECMHVPEHQLPNQYHPGDGDVRIPKESLMEEYGIGGAFRHAMATALLSSGSQVVESEHPYEAKAANWFRLESDGGCVQTAGLETTLCSSNQLLSNVVTAGNYTSSGRIPSLLCRQGFRWTKEVTIPGAAALVVHFYNKSCTYETRLRPIQILVAKDV
ncbi:unnamed protein product [Symbiodinium microadriaticum]|nr:unnamed protein product [Symbiodinium microadriaticum]